MVLTSGKYAVVVSIGYGIPPDVVGSGYGISSLVSLGFAVPGWGAGDSVVVIIPVATPVSSGIGARLHAPTNITKDVIRLINSRKENRVLIGILY